MGKKRATSGLVVEVLTTEADVDAIVEEWADLAVRAEVTPFGLPEVALAWWRHLGRGRLIVGTVRDRSGALTALAPLHERRIAGVPVLRWLGHGLGSVAAVVSIGDNADATGLLWNALSDGRRVLQLSEFRHDGGGLLGLRRATPWELRAVLADRCPVIEVVREPVGMLARVDDEQVATQAVEAFLAGRRNLRHLLSKADRAVAATGLAFTTTALTTAADIEAVTDELTALTTRAEAARPRQHLLAAPYREFTLDALASAASQGRAAVFVGRLGEDVVCFDLAFRAGRMLGDWMGRMDPEQVSINPGHLLLRDEFCWALEHGVEVIDLLVGDDEYKRRWSTGSYDTLDVVAAPPGRLAVAIAGLQGVEHAHHLVGKVRRGLRRPS